MKKSLCCLLTLITIFTMIFPIHSSAVSFGNAKYFSDKIVPGNMWILISSAHRQYTSRDYFGVKLTKLTSIDKTSDYTYMKAKIVNENDVALTSTQTIAKSSTAIYQFDLLVTTNDDVYLSAKGNKPTLDARVDGVFYAN